VSTKTIEIFTGPNCAYCENAKALLDRKGVVYREYDVSADPQHLEEFSRRLPRTRAIPQVFVDGEHIGSWEDLQHLESSGRLAETIGAAGG
jgi:glutaredoxin 3